MDKTVEELYNEIQTSLEAASTWKSNEWTDSSTLTTTSPWQGTSTTWIDNSQVYGPITLPSSSGTYTFPDIEQVAIDRCHWVNSLTEDEQLKRMVAKEDIFRFIFTPTENVIAIHEYLTKL